MKTQFKWLATAVVSGFAIVNSASAAFIISNFHDFTSDLLFASWNAPATVIVGGANTTNYTITATGYGSNWKAIPTNDPVVETNVELTVDLSAANPTAAAGELGPIVEIVDNNDTIYTYAFYGQQLGHHVLNMSLNNPSSITAGTNGSTTLEITNLQGIHMELDPSGYTSASYTIAWDLLRLTGVGDTNSTPPPPFTEIFNFVDFTSDALYGQWASGATPAPTIGGGAGTTNYVITAANGEGSNYKGMTTYGIMGAGDTNLQVNVNLTPSNLGVFIELIDGSGNDYIYKWYGLAAGDNVLNIPVQSPTVTNAVGTTPGLNLNNLYYSHIGVDPGTYLGSYTVAWDNVALTYSGSSVITSGPIKISSVHVTPAGGNTSNVALTWTATPGASYSVLGSTNLATGAGFQTLMSGITTSNQTVQVTGNTGFFKVTSP